MSKKVDLDRLVGSIGVEEATSLYLKFLTENNLRSVLESDGPLSEEFHSIIKDKINPHDQTIPNEYFYKILNTLKASDPRN